jgi:hypothetical protein
MRSFISFLFLFLAAALGLPGVYDTAAQDQSYSSVKAGFVIDLPSPTWRLIDEPSEMHQHTEFVYGDRLDGYLRIRKETVEEGLNLRDFADRDQDQKTRFLPGYVNGKEDPFSGRLSGVTRSYEFTERGKAMVGRTYYLQGDNRTVFVLRFTGLREKLLRIRNQTDAIARSLRTK